LFRITSAVPLFLVVVNPWNNSSKLADLLDDLGAVEGMELNGLPFIGG